MSSGETPRQVAIRTTAGQRIGFGHLRRCLTLAQELARRGPEVVFWIDGDPESLPIVQKSGFVAQLIDQHEPTASLELVARLRPSALVVDSYAMDGPYFEALHGQVDCLAVIDDLANRPIKADLVVNGAANAPRLGYKLNAGCELLRGPQYALLRPSFTGRAARPTAESVKRVLVTLGGADVTGATRPVLGEVAAALPEAEIDVIVGPLFTSVGPLHEYACSLGPRVVLHTPEDPVYLMEVADLAVSAGGQTLYELSACGVPTIALCVADNQRGQMDAMVELGVLQDAGPASDGAGFPGLRGAIDRLAADRPRRERMSRAGQSLVDGLGARRAASAICDRIYGQTGRPSVRRSSHG